MSEQALDYRPDGFDGIDGRQGAFFWFGRPPFFGSPFFGSPFFGSPFFGSPFLGSPFFGSPFFGSPFFGGFSGFRETGEQREDGDDRLFFPFFRPFFFPFLFGFPFFF